MSFKAYSDGSGFKLQANMLGSLAKIADAERDLFLECQWRATKEEGDKIKEAARNSVRAAPIKGARRMATSWRGDIFPHKPPPYSNRPAYILGTNAAMPLDHLETGITITAKGDGLLIPIQEAARFKQPAFTEQSGRLARVIQAMTQKYGKLSWFNTRKGRFLGAWTRNRAGKDRFVALFMVRKSVTIPKKLDTRAVIARAGQGAPERIAAKTMERFAREHDARVERATRTR
ncbi:MAG TPA: DUF6441 family protein [Terricaulis sp.]|nr:DUF6441 family protein [Terricaulis sp.]